MAAGYTLTHTMSRASRCVMHPHMHLHISLLPTHRTISHVSLRVTPRPPQMQPWVGIIVLFTMASYLPLTVIVTEANTRFRRAQNKLSNERSARMTDTLLNYENAKFFTGEIQGGLIRASICRACCGWT